MNGKVRDISARTPAIKGEIITPKPIKLSKKPAFFPFSFFS